MNAEVRKVKWNKVKSLLSDRAAIEGEINSLLASLYPRDKACIYQTDNMTRPRSGAILGARLYSGFPRVSIKPNHKIKGSCIAVQPHFVQVL